MARWRQQVWRAGSGSGAAGLVVIATTLMWAAEGDWSEFASVAPFGFLPQGHQPHPATPPPTAPPPPGTRVLAEHISLGGTPSPETMSVSWHTDGPVPAPLVRWGEAAGDGKGMEMEIATGETQVYLVSPNRSAYVHRASIGPIVAGRSYSYQAMHKGGPEGLAYSFVMPSGHLAAPHHPVSTSPPPQRVIIFGDSGNSVKWSNGTVPAVAAEVGRGGVAAIIHTGDMAYYAKADGGRRGGTHAEELSNATGHSTALMTVVGNGDVFCYRAPGIPEWASCTEDYQRRYIMPGWNRTHGLWSSFDIGPVHYILLDSEAATWCGGVQNQTLQRIFIESDLAAVDRALHPWVIAVVHRPLYTSCLNGKEQATMQQQFGDLFLRHKVDVVLSGHVHSYERTWPTTGGYSNATNATSQVFPDRSVYANPKYPVYIVSGAAGNGESVDNCTRDMARMVPYPWSFSAAYSNDIGFNRMWAHNATHLEFDYVSVFKAKAIDHFWIVRTK